MRRIPVSLKSRDELSLIKQYLHLTKSVHGLTDRPIDVVAVLIKLSREENGDLRNLLTSSERRAHLRDELNISENAFNSILMRLRRGGAIKDNKLTSLFNAIQYDHEGMQLVINLVLNAEEG